MINAPRSSKGFTLIELLIVAALSVMLMLFLVPQMIQFNHRRELTSATRNVVAEMRLAHKYATSGVQNDSIFVNAYRISLLRYIDDPSGIYRGYTITQVDENDNDIAPSLDTEIIACPICVISTESKYDFKVPTGQVTNISSFPSTFRLCYEGIGETTVSVDQFGNTTNGNFTESTCSCNVVSCSYSAPTPTTAISPTATPTVQPTSTPTLGPTPTPTNTPIPTNTPTPTLVPTNTPVPTDTPTPTNTPSPTPGPTATPTNTPTPTDTPVPTPTPVSCSIQADCLDVDTSGAYVGGSTDKELRGIQLRNTDSSASIYVDEMMVTWSKSGKQMRRIKIDGNTVWSGRADSGDYVDISDYYPSTSWEDLTKIRFNASVSGAYFTITFKMGDGSTKTVNYQD